MRIIVTGGAGFIGSWVAGAFIDQGHEVLIIDNLSTGNANNIPKKADFIKGDVRESDFLNSTLSDFKPDVVNHHAAQVDVRKSVESPALDAEINILGTLNLLELSVRHNVNRFVFASTGGAIYGDPQIIPADEGTPPVPISPYGASKYAAEVYIKYYNCLYSLNYVALRYANVYGPRQNPHGEAGVVAIFCDKILSGETCLVFGDGNQTRDYVYVGDVADANLKSLSAPSGSYNLGTGVETSVNGLISELRQSVGKDFSIRHADARPGEVEKISLDAELAKEKLGWSPAVSLQEGIRITWEWFK